MVLEYETRRRFQRDRARETQLIAARASAIRQNRNEDKWNGALSNLRRKTHVISYELLLLCICLFLSGACHNDDNMKKKGMRKLTYLSLAHHFF